jgi:hypothetical protein
MDLDWRKSPHMVSFLFHDHHVKPNRCTLCNVFQVSYLLVSVVTLSLKLRVVSRIPKQSDRRGFPKFFL